MSPGLLDVMVPQGFDAFRINDPRCRRQIGVELDDIGLYHSDQSVRDWERYRPRPSGVHRKTQWRGGL